MKTKKKLLGTALIVFILSLSAGVLSAQPPEWLDGWAYRKEINITENSGNDLTDYQVKIPVVYESKMQSDFSDLRFTDSDGTTLLSYWVEEYTEGSSATVWVKIPDIPASGVKTIYMYYGNPPAGSASNFDNTFTKDYGESGLVGLWHFDEGGGTSATDSSGNGNTGTLKNGTITCANGDCPTWQSTDGGQWDNRDDVKFSTGSALRFDGVNDYVDCGNDPSLNITDEITIEAWVDTSLSYQYIVGKYEEAAFLQYWGYGLFVDGGHAEFRIGTTHLYYNVKSTKLINDSNWHHIVGVYDKMNLIIYVDGQQTAGGHYSGDISPASSSFKIGKCQMGFSERFFNGVIDEVRVYNRALSQEEIKAHYERRKYISSEPTVSVGASESKKSELVAWWKFDEGNGSIAHDISNNSNDGVIHGAIWTTGKLGSALEFDGMNDYVDCGNDASLDITDELTVESWINWKGGGAVYHVIFTKGYYILGSNYYMMVGRDGTFYFSIFSQSINVENAISPNTWIHVAGTYDGNIRKAYINGELRASKALSLPVHTNNQPLFIGKANPGYYPFKGAIDDVKIYNRALTPEEILAHYQAGIMGTISGTVKNTSNNSIQGAKITVNGYSDTTNSTGEYTITLPVGNYNVTASATGYQDQSKQAKVKEDQITEINFTLTKLSYGTISGRVIYAHNVTGISGATVKLTDAGVVASTSTDSEGKYSFLDVPYGIYNINVSKTRFWSNSTSVNLTGLTKTVGDILLWLKGDLNNNGIPTDIGDLVLMKRACLGDITPDWRYDLNDNGLNADGVDLFLMKRATLREMMLT